MGLRKYSKVDFTDLRKAKFLKTLEDHQKELEDINLKRTQVFEKYQKDPNLVDFIKNILLVNYSENKNITLNRIDAVIVTCLVKMQTNPSFNAEKKEKMEFILKKFYDEHPTKNDLTQFEKDSNSSFEGVCDQIGRTIEAL